MTHEEQYTGDDWRCRCGNTPMSSGFQPCTSSGQIVEPTEETWPESLYACVQCGVIIHYDEMADEGEVVGETAAVPTDMLADGSKP